MIHDFQALQMDKIGPQDYDSLLELSGKVLLDGLHDFHGLHEQALNYDGVLNVLVEYYVVDDLNQNGGYQYEYYQVEND